MRFVKLFWIAALTTMPAWTADLRADGNPLMAEAGDFTITVERLPDVLSASSLNVKDLEEATRVFTRQNNLPVNSKSRSWLYLRIGGASVLEGQTTIGYAYNVRLHFKQNARSMTSDAMATVSSWSSRGTSGVAQPGALHREVHAALQDELHEFARAWTTSHGGQ